jgi:formylglycine-generating enzyme required for sulfatase activity
MTDCGEAGNESCCTSLEVPGGTYDRSYDHTVDGSVEVDPDGGAVGLADPATVSGFRLDKYEVTVGRFRQFVKAWNHGWTPDAGSGVHGHLNGGQGLANGGGAGFEPGWVAADDGNLAPTDSNLTTTQNCLGAATWTPTASGNEELAMNCMNWWEAYAFCIWDGGFLPSEAEWGYAAAGGSQQREYPWGSTAPGTTNAYAIFNCQYPPGSTSCTIAPVGTAAAGKGVWGQLDLAGNVWEWMLDWEAPYFDPCMDCAYLTESAGRAIRGGSFYTNTVTDLVTSGRSAAAPIYRLNVVGVRCARPP